MRASLASIAAVAISFLLAACGPGDESAPVTATEAEESIDQLVPALVDAIQAKQPVFVMDHVAPEFVEEGGLDYFGVRSLVEAYAFRDEEVGARLESVSIQPAADGAQAVAARVSFALGQRLSEGAALPASATTYSLDLVFERRGARWQVVRGRYRRE